MIIKEKNISYVVKKGLCHQCGTCYSICPNDCITIKRDAINNYVPVIDDQFCNKCKLCLKVCPGLEVDFGSLINKYEEGSWHAKIGHYQKTFLGYSLNEDIRYRSSSGGLVPAILIHLLESGKIDGAIVVKGIENDPFNPQVFIAKSSWDILDSMQSRYHPVCLNTVLKDIAISNGKFAIVGLPCHIHGLKKYARFKAIDKKIFLSIGLFCGLNLRFDSLEFLAHKAGQDFTNLENVNYREGKWPGKTVLKYAGNNRFDVDKNSINHIYTLPRCLYCIDHTSEMADISCGDAWLKEVLKMDDSGWSAVISRSYRGQEVLEELQKKKKCFLEHTDVEKIIESQYPMLCFKKNNSWLRMKIRQITGGAVPQYASHSLSKSLNLFYFVGNIILMLVVYLMKCDRFKRLIMNIPVKIINVYKILIIKLLYRDKFLLSIGKKFRRIVTARL